MINYESVSNIKEACITSKKYLLIYLVFVMLFFASTISSDTIAHPKFEAITLILIIFLGFASIIYYFLHNSDEELFKVAFVIILCFGIICSLIVPIVDVSDEVEHLARAEITSQGVIIPHWTGEDIGVDRLYNHTDGEEISDKMNDGAGYASIDGLKFFSSSREMTVYDTEHDTDVIDKSEYLYHSAFEQNPFYGYLPQAIGVFIAKLFDLNIIWMLWLARIANLLCYAGLISLAIKISPKFKMPLLAVACIPIAIYQAASASIDSMIFSLGILTISYFIYLCTLSEITIKHITIFSVLSLLLGLCKLPYLAFIFLLIFIPKKNFKDNQYYYVIFGIIVVGIIGVLYSRYSTQAVLHSWRSAHNYVNSTAQLNYLITNPIQISNFFVQIFTTDLGFVLNGVFNFYNGKLGPHYQDHYVFITSCLQIFLAIMLLAFPEIDKFKLKTKLGALIVLFIVYIGFSFVQLLIWSDVGKLDLGMSTRYFIPLFALVPVIVPHREYFSKDRFNNYAIVFIIIFMATLIVAFATKYY